MNFQRDVLVCVLLLLWMCIPAQAQTSKGTIVGVVRDATGAVIANAKVTVTAQETSESRGAVADAQGGFRIEAVNPGHYTVHVQAGGFEEAEVRDLNVIASAVTTCNP